MYQNNFNNFDFDIELNQKLIFLFSKFQSIKNIVLFSGNIDVGQGHRSQRQFGLSEGISQSPESQVLSRSLNVSLKRTEISTAVPNIPVSTIRITTTEKTATTKSTTTKASTTTISTTRPTTASTTTSTARSSTSTVSDVPEPLPNPLPGRF